MLLPELQKLAGELSISGTGRMRKGELIAAIQAKQSGGSADTASVAAVPAPRAEQPAAQLNLPVATEDEPAPAAEPSSGRARTRRAASRPAGAPASTEDAPAAAEQPAEAPAAQPPAAPSAGEQQDGGGASADTGQQQDQRGERPDRQRNRSRNDSRDRNTGDRDRNAGDRDRNAGDRDNRGENRNSGDRNPADRGAGDRNSADRNENRDGGERNDRGQNDRGERGGQNDRSQGERGQGDRTQNDRSQNDRTQNDRGNRNSNQNQGGPNSGQNQGAGQGHPNDQDDDGEGGSRRRRGRFRERNRRGGRETGSPGPRERFTNESEPQVADDDVLIPVAGIVDILDNYAFIRTSGYLTGPNDVYVSLSQVRKNGLRRGDAVTGAVRQPRDGERRDKYNALVRLDTVNGMEPEQSRNRPEFHKLTPLYPQSRLRLETEPHILTTRVIDLVMPLGKGQRALIVSPPKAGKTMVLQAIANAITHNNPECHLMVVLVDERPEEVTDMTRSVKGEVIASTFDRPPSDHTTVAELSIERAKRLVELGHDVIVLLDSITRLGRAYNLAAPASGRILSGGVDSTALYPPKRFLGAARNIENGGSLT
ncbi:MAG: transcription termination factor Rho, partial [Cryptosporangiaceae bacterium]|nr:transcription termination factor Rho [Cryptosporangiaceae bacterium]